MEVIPMPNKDGKGPKGEGQKDGHGGGKGKGTSKPAGPKKGGGKGRMPIAESVVEGDVACRDDF